MKQNGEHESPQGAETRTAQSIGIEVHGGRAIVLIPSGSRTPVARAMTFTTVADGQKAVEVRVVRCSQGEGLSFRPSGVVGRFLVPGLRTGRRGEARIDIGISLDREGIIRAWGVDRSTGARQEGTFAGLWALPPRARPPAVAALARRVHASLARPEFEGTSGPGGNVLDGATADGPALAALVGEIDSIRRSTAAPPVPTLMAALPGAAVMPVGIAQLGKTLLLGREESLRAWAAWTLGERGQVSAYGYLRHALWDPAESVRESAVEAIGSLAVRQSAGELAALYAWSSPRLRRAIMRAVRRIGYRSEFDGILCLARQDPDARVRALAARAGRAVAVGRRRP